MAFQTYGFEILSCDFREINPKFHMIYMSVRLSKNNPGGLPPKIFVLPIGNDYDPDSHWNSWFGGNLWYLLALLKGAMELRQEIKLTLPYRIENFDVEEIDTLYGMYEYHPRPLSRIESLVISNEDDPSNFYKFNWSKPRPQMPSSAIEVFNSAGISGSKPDEGES